MTATDPTNIPDPGAPQGPGDRITTPEAHNHSGEPKVWCETCQHTHIASIPEVTYACHSCGFGSWHSETATEHESLCPGHETYPLGHIVRTLPDRPSDLAAEVEHRGVVVDAFDVAHHPSAEAPDATHLEIEVEPTGAFVIGQHVTVAALGITVTEEGKCGWCGGPAHDPGDCMVAQQEEAQRLCDADRIYEEGNDRG